MTMGGFLLITAVGKNKKENMEYQNSKLLSYALILTLLSICLVFAQGHLMSKGKSKNCPNNEIAKKHKILDDLDLSKIPNQCLQELEIEFPPDLIVHPMGSVLDLHLVQDEPKVLLPKKFDGKTVTIAMVDPDAPRGTNPTARYCLQFSLTFYSQLSSDTCTGCPRSKVSKTKGYILVMKHI